MHPKEYNTIPLGKKIAHSQTYNPSHLFAVPRAEARAESNIPVPLPFTGTDIWNAWEISWLNAGGKPVVVIGEFYIPCETDMLIESKSLKLYLNSFNLTKFSSAEAVRQTIQNDLEAILKMPIQIRFYDLDHYPHAVQSAFSGQSIDDIDISTECYHTDPTFLSVQGPDVEDVLYSNLLRTNCPVTGQPDWGSVFISYKGQKISHKGLLKYIISFRNHTGFHENCVEKIFMDIKTRCRPEALRVEARFTRRGGLDINPIRTDSITDYYNTRTVRQ